MARTYQPADDQLILERIESETLSVSLRGDSVLVRSSCGDEWKPLAIERSGRGNEYRSVRLHKDGKRLRVSLHRLVWIAANMIAVPAGCEIHHKRGADCNSIDDLECVSVHRHIAIHAAEKILKPADDVPF